MPKETKGKETIREAAHTEFHWSALSVRLDTPRIAKGHERKQRARHGRRAIRSGECHRPKSLRIGAEKRPWLLRSIGRFVCNLGQVSINSVLGNSTRIGRAGTT